MARTLVPIAVGLLTVASPLAVAQEKEQGSRVGSILEEVMVTARKRPETAQDAPIAVSAFSAESLAARGIAKIDEIGRITPNVNYQNNPAIGGSSSVATVYIRGIGQRDFLGTIDNGSGFYIDDVIVARTVGAVVDLLDVERVEVLRGPQGTLHGRNNVGGAIKIHSKKPDKDAGAYIELSYGTDNLTSLKGTSHFGFGSNSAFSVSGLYKSQDGFVRRPAGHDLGASEVAAARLAFYAEPADKLSISASASYSREDDGGPAFTLKQTGADVRRGFASFYNNLNSGTPDCAGPGGLTASNPRCYNDGNYLSNGVNFGTAPTFSHTEVTSLAVDIRYAVNDKLSLRSVSGYRDLDAQFARDADASPLVVVHFFDNFVAKQFSQEFQLNATLFGDRLDLVSGLFYFDESGNNLNLLEFAIANFQSGSEFGTQSRAIYTQATLHLTERWDFTIGARYTDEDKSFLPDQVVGANFIGIPYFDAAGNCVAQNRARMGPGAPILPAPAPACPVRQLPQALNELNTSALNPMVNIAYQFTDSAMGYFTYSEGFRSGGFAQRIFPPLPFAPSFGPEFVDSFEVGVKYRRDQLVVNAAAFFTDYTDIQVVAESPGLIGLFEDNVGDAEISGFELETAFNAGETLLVEFSYGYTDARYTAIRVEPPLISSVSPQDSFDHVPEHSLAAALTKEFLFANGNAFIARIEATHTTEFANDADNSPPIFTPDVTLLNASARWLPGSGRYVLALGVKNLTDEQFIQSGYNNESIATAEVIRDRGVQYYATGRINF